MSDPMVNILGDIWVRRSRYRDWFMGRRPLPDSSAADDRFFFEMQVKGGMISEEEAAFWLRRHRQMQRIENGPTPTGDSQ